MSAFSDIKMVWEGVEYTIPSTKIFGAIIRVEKVITLGELHKMGTTGNYALSKLAQAYAELLTYAGATEVDAEKVYIGMFSKGQHEMSVIKTSVYSLLLLMVPKVEAPVEAKSGEA